MTRTKALIEARHRLMGRNLSLAYEKPLHIVRGSMQYLYDDEGRRWFAELVTRVLCDSSINVENRVMHWR